VQSEHLKLIRDLFHALSIAAFGVALFASGIEISQRLVAFAGAAYAHCVAQFTIMCDKP
jgi:hypothetical protein